MYELSILTFLAIGKILSIEINTTKGENSMIGSFSFDFSSVYAQLTSFAKLENFWSLFETAFGSSYDFATAASFRSQWQSQDFSLFPQIEVVSSDVLGSAKGAYAISTNKIYLSDQFVSLASQPSLDAVILEEFGHFVDAQVNATDTPGDEGELFSAIVRGVNLSSAELSRIEAEDDHAVITVDGRSITVEQSLNLVGVWDRLSYANAIAVAGNYAYAVGDTLQQFPIKRTTKKLSQRLKVETTMLEPIKSIFISNGIDRISNSFVKSLDCSSFSRANNFF